MTTLWVHYPQYWSASWPNSAFHPGFVAAHLAPSVLFQSLFWRFETRCLICVMIWLSSLNVLGGTWKHISWPDEIRAHEKSRYKIDFYSIIFLIQMNLPLSCNFLLLLCCSIFKQSNICRQALLVVGNYRQWVRSFLTAQWHTKKLSVCHSGVKSWNEIFDKYHR